MREDDMRVGVAMQEACLTLEQIASACAVEREWVLRRVHEGLLASLEGPETEWRFTVATLRRARRMRQVERDFDAVPELAALMSDLLDEMDALRERLALRGLR